MYLKKLYKHSKFWFAVIIFFISAQLFINYKRGVVCTPFFHYGMYSEVIKPSDNYKVPEVVINGQRLAQKDFSPQQWDNIMQPLIKYYDQAKWNSNLFQKDIHRLMPFSDSLCFINNISEDEFKTWYKQRLESITNSKIDNYNIAFTRYIYNGKIFIKSTAQPY